MRRLFVSIPFVLLLVLAAGCVKRKVLIRTVPAGAEVYVDGKYAGISPVEVGFVYYGNHPIRIKKEGYRVVVGTLALEAPWYQKPGLDFFSENVYPGVVTDEREVVFHLEKAPRADADEALQRAEEMKRRFEDFRRREKGKNSR